MPPTVLTHADGHAIALTRIREEAARRSGELDLGGLGLEELPEELFALTHLRVLKLATDHWWDSTIHNNRINAQSDRLGGFTALEHLSVAGTDIDSLTSIAGLRSLSLLDCSSTMVSDLTPLSGLAGLQTLDCSSTPVSDLTPLAGAPGLQALHCSDTPISDLTPLAGIPGLKALHCSDTSVSDLTPLAGHSQLQRLICSSTPVSDLTPLSALAGLETLSCNATKVSDLTPLATLVSLQALACSNTSVKDLTPLSGLTTLQTLSCSNTQVSNLAPLSGLTKLQTLHCSDTLVSDLTPLTGLVALQTLHCSDTPVSDLTPLSGLTALQTLSCSGTLVSDLTPLAGLAGLRTLSCYATQVNDLTPLSGSASLQALYCFNTGVKDVAPLSGLPVLRELHASLCPIQSLPVELVNLPSLESLLLYDCIVPGIPPVGILSNNPGDNCLSRLRAHLADLESDPAPITSVKLLLLGNGGVGKTQIARWLTGKDFDPNWNSTHGIEIGRSTLPGDDGIALRVWDFGGQDIYHGAHALFITSPAVQAVVWARCVENEQTQLCNGLEFRNQPLPYWVDVARHQGHRASPLLVIQSQCDRPEDEERRMPLTDAQWETRGFLKTLHVSAKEGRGRGALEDALRDAVRWLRDPARLGMPMVGAGRLRVQRRLEAMRDADAALPPAERRHRLLTMEEFRAICAEEGGVSSPEHLLTWLDAEGTVIHRPGLFRDRIVLDQNWALEAVYAVFDRDRGALTEISRAGGRFTRGLLARLVWRDHGDGERDLFIDLMRSCGIAFRHRQFTDGAETIEEYIAPDLLPDRTTVADVLRGRWDDDRPTESAVFQHPLLHGGLIRAIMAELGEMAGADALYWQGGLCGFEATSGSRFRIEQAMTGPWQGEIRVEIQRGHATALLDRLVELVERAQARIGLTPASVERSSPARPERQEEERPPMTFAQEKPKAPEWYVSYAWGDGTSEGIARERVVDDLCAAAEARGLVIQRDKNVMGMGDSISAFMRRIGAGDRVFVILSDKYLRSPHCMFELSEIWRNSKQMGDGFRERVRVYALPDATVWKPTDWLRWAIHWKTEFDELDTLARTHGPALLGEIGSARLRQMQVFYTQVTDILGTIADTVQPRTLEQLIEYGLDDAGE